MPHNDAHDVKNFLIFPPILNFPVRIHRGVRRASGVHFRVYRIGRNRPNHWKKRLLLGGFQVFPPGRPKIWDFHSKHKFKLIFKSARSKFVTGPNFKAIKSTCMDEPRGTLKVVQPLHATYKCALADKFSLGTNPNSKKVISGGMLLSNTFKS